MGLSASGVRRGRPNPLRFWLWCALIGIMQKSLTVVVALLATAILTTCGETTEPVPEKAAAKDEYFVYIGTYTKGDSEGIYAYRFDAASGQLGSLGAVAKLREPSFLAIHPNSRFLYAVSETDDFDADKNGSVSAFEIDAESGSLTALNTVPSKGAWPCHLNVDQTGTTLAVANYRSGTVATISLDADGKLGAGGGVIQSSGSSVHPRQQSPHAHCVDFSPDNRYLISADLGTDQVDVFRVDPQSAALKANDPAFAKVNPGAGPRHFAFHPNAKYGYVINELQSTVTAFDWDSEQGSLTEIQTISTLPEDFTGESTTAEIAVHHSGKFLYGSNRGHDSIAVFTIDESSGKLTATERTSTQGKKPRSFSIDPSGHFLFAVNQDTNSLVLFRIDQQTGRLTQEGEPLQVPSPVCVKFVKVG